MINFVLQVCAWMYTHRQVSNILFPNRWQAFGNVYWIYQNDKMPMDRSTLRQKLKFFSQINCLFTSIYVVLSTDLSIQNDKPSASEVKYTVAIDIWFFFLPQSGTVEYLLLGETCALSPFLLKRHRSVIGWGLCQLPSND